MKRKVLGVLFTAMCLCAVPSAAYAEAQEAETTEAAGGLLMSPRLVQKRLQSCPTACTIFR